MIISALKTLIGALIISFSSIMHADKPISMKLTVDANKPDFVIKLPSNPTTGFQWKVVAYDEQLFTMSKTKYIAPKSKLIGAGGERWFTFTLNKGQSYPICAQFIFKYARPWEKESATMKKVVIEFR